MELEEMQAAWTAMSGELAQQKKLTNELIMKMTQERYTNTWNHVRNFEIFGTLICYAILLYLLFNFGKLDTTPLRIFGSIAAVSLAILPILSLKTIRGMKEINVTSMTIKEILETYSKRKKQFVYFQKFNVFMSFLLMLVVVPVSGKIMNNEDLLSNFDDKLLLAMPIMFVFFGLLMWFAIYTYKRILNKSQRMIDEATKRS